MSVVIWIFAGVPGAALCKWRWPAGRGWRLPLRVPVVNSRMAIELEAIAESAKAARVSPIGESANASIPAKGMICRIVLAPYHTC